MAQVNVVLTGIHMHPGGIYHAGAVNVGTAERYGLAGGMRTAQVMATLVADHNHVAAPKNRHFAVRRQAYRIDTDDAAVQRDIGLRYHVKAQAFGGEHLGARHPEKPGLGVDVAGNLAGDALVGL